jgi:hypothetical protein
MKALLCIDYLLSRIVSSINNDLFMILKTLMHLVLEMREYIFRDLDIMASLRNSSIFMRNIPFSGSQTLIKKHVNKMYFNNRRIHSKPV